jgi:hypothetical protein
MTRLRILWIIVCATCLSGCQSAASKSWLDLIQYFLEQPDWVSWAFCVFFVILFVQSFKFLGAAFRSIRWSWRIVKKVIFRPNWRNLLACSFFGSILWMLSGPISDGLQYIEYAYLKPAYVGQYDSWDEAHLTALYEAELARHTDTYECEVIKRRTREMAVRIKSTPLAIYECAWLECGLRPFTIRNDQVAAGWIQFTRVGLGGLTWHGQSVRFEQVLTACRQRDINFIMDLTEAYLVDKYQRAGERSLNNTIDLYLALFAPALIGAPHDRIVYQGYQNPSYYLNAGLDGWYTMNTQSDARQIIRKKSACDGRITIYEMYLALEAKKSVLIRVHRPKND